MAFSIFKAFLPSLWYEGVDDQLMHEDDTDGDPSWRTRAMIRDQRKDPRRLIERTEKMHLAGLSNGVPHMPPVIRPFNCLTLLRSHIRDANNIVKAGPSL